MGRPSLSSDPQLPGKAPAALLLLPMQKESLPHPRPAPALQKVGPPVFSETLHTASPTSTAFAPHVLNTPFRCKPQLQDSGMSPCTLPGFSSCFGFFLLTLAPRAL